MTTNEELVSAIQAGHKELIPQLWERVCGLYYRNCNGLYARFEGLFIAHGVTIRDLEQECFFAFLESLRGYSADDGLKFSTYTRLPLLKMRDRLLFNRQKPDPLNAAVSLSTPINNESQDMCELVDTIKDSVEQSPERYSEQRSMRDIVKAAIDRLDGNEKRIIIDYFFENVALSATAKQLNISRQRAAQIKNAALDKLRQDRQLIALHNALNVR